MYVEDWENLIIKSKSQLLRATFLAKYGGLDLYDIYLEKDSSLIMNNFNLIKILNGH